MNDLKENPRWKTQQFRYQAAHFCDQRLRLRYRDIGHGASDAFGFSFNFHVLNNHPPPQVQGDHYGQRRTLKKRSLFPAQISDHQIFNFRRHHK